jgi:hypothetical protein
VLEESIDSITQKTVILSEAGHNSIVACFAEGPASAFDFPCSQPIWQQDPFGK